MTGRQCITYLAILLFFCVPSVALAQSTSPNRITVINGQSAQVPVIQVKGRSYADLGALASALNGSVSFSDDQIVLSVPVGPVSSASGTSAAAPPASAATPTPAPNPGFSKGFLNAGIEQMSTLREWHAALASAIQNGYSVNADMLAPYRAQANTNLRLAANAVSTPSDRNALQLLTNEFQNMAKLADKYVKARANMTYFSPDALDNDSLNQRIVSCGHSLGSMAASGQFVDDGSCD